MDAENIYPVFDWLWTSGQLSETDISMLPARGIETVINLALPTSSPALPGEADYVTREGMNYIQIPVEWEHPELQQLIAFFGVLKAFEGRRIWVHCAKNMRVSAFVFLYRRLCLEQPEAASSHPMQDIWVPNPIWQVFIEHAWSLRADPTYNWPAFSRQS